MITCLGKKMVHSVYCACLSWAFVKFCLCPSFLFGIECRMWVVIVLIPDHCFSVYFRNTYCRDVRQTGMIT